MSFQNEMRNLLRPEKGSKMVGITPNNEKDTEKKGGRVPTTATREGKQQTASHPRNPGEKCSCIVGGNPSRQENEKKTGGKEY